VAAFCKKGGRAEVEVGGRAGRNGVPGGCYMVSISTTTLISIYLEKQISAAFGLRLLQPAESASAPKDEWTSPNNWRHHLQPMVWLCLVLLVPARKKKAWVESPLVTVSSSTQAVVGAVWWTPPPGHSVSSTTLRRLFRPRGCVEFG
jgi:hypothetical protein